MTEEFINRLETLNKDADCTPDDVEFLINDWRTLTTKLKEQEALLKEVEEALEAIRRDGRVQSVSKLAREALTKLRKEKV